MKVAREVQVDFLHGQHLGITTAGSAALDAETRTERRLAQCHDGAFADFVQTECQTDAHRGLADARFRRTDGGH